MFLYRHCYADGTDIKEISVPFLKKAKFQNKRVRRDGVTCDGEGMAGAASKKG